MLLSLSCTSALPPMLLLLRSRDPARSGGEGSVYSDASAGCCSVYGGKSSPASPKIDKTSESSKGSFSKYSI
ncbi:hypothetical protein K431DRAFT_282814 [Polychaeton citri CBS 116435]|uniref:Uncharacterized protein n=1 Tax=Polychaeton citri CBS 116435 TaxID=1314669 RepID=A0A9P4USJ3_9PEZI|nr:hypothetical protein K431DRAFT_282814 [Polychaeton citri CBS 116435]